MNRFINGTLIVGGAGVGKTRVLKDSLETLLTLFPQVKIIYAGVGDKTNLGKLENNLQHEFFIRSDFRDCYTSVRFLERVKELMTTDNLRQDFIIAIDEFAHFFNSPLQFMEFAELFKMPNSRIHLWMTVQHLAHLSTPLAYRLAESFSEYIILHHFKEQELFQKFGVDTSLIARGEALRLNLMPNGDFKQVNLMSRWKIFRKNFYFADQFGWLKFLWSYYCQGSFNSAR